MCVNDDLAWFGHDGHPPAPTSLADLAKPAYRKLLVVENPASSSPGLAFLLATIDAFGEDGWQDYWKKLRDNGVRVVDGWEQAYDADFTAGGGSGDRPLVVSYATVAGGRRRVLGRHEEGTRRSAWCPEPASRQIEFAGVLAQRRGTRRAPRR